jgi:predicted ester cyclase
MDGANLHPRPTIANVTDPAFGGTRCHRSNTVRESAHVRSTSDRGVPVAGDAGDLDAFDDLLHADAVIHAPAGLSTTSAEAEKVVWKDALAAMPDLRHHVQEVVVDGDIEMARVVVSGTLAAGFAGVDGTERSFQIDQAVITHLRDGKVAEAWEIADIAALREQVAPG